MKLFGFKTINALLTTAFLAGSMSHVSFMVNANEQNDIVQTETHSKAGLKALLGNMDAFQSPFLQKVEDLQGNVVHEAEGVLSMARPNQLRWETTFPDESLLIADGTTIWNIDHFVEQVTMLDQANTIIDNPIVLLTSNDETVWDNFIVTSNEDNQHYQIEPVEKTGQITRLIMRFNEEQELTDITLHDAQQQTSHIVFIAPQSVLSGVALFDTTIPEGYTVDDQR